MCQSGILSQGNKLEKKQRTSVVTTATTSAGAGEEEEDYYDYYDEEEEESGGVNKSSIRILENYKKMSQLVLKSLSILLGIFFIFLGIIKVTPFVDKDLHKDMRKEFVKYAKVFPLAQTLSFKIPSKWYRRSVGGLEILCGSLLAFFPNAQVKRGTNLALLILTILSVYSHLLVDEKFERTAPALVFFFMLSCRLVVEFQNERKLLKLMMMSKRGSQDESQQQLVDGAAASASSGGSSNNVDGKLQDKID